MGAVGVIGSGAWGTTLALLLARKGISTTLWDHHAGRAATMHMQRENSTFLPAFSFPDALEVTSSIAEAVQGKETLLLVPPSQRLRENLRILAPHLSPATLLVSASKGIEIASLKRMTEGRRRRRPATRCRCPYTQLVKHHSISYLYVRGRYWRRAWRRAQKYYRN
jgi:glycerol-3-phosphate dehydrogenase (NAD(P)+)